MQLAAHVPLINTHIQLAGAVTLLFNALASVWAAVSGGTELEPVCAGIAGELADGGSECFLDEHDEGGGESWGIGGIMWAGCTIIVLSVLPSVCCLVLHLKALATAPHPVPHLAVVRCRRACFRRDAA